MLQCVAVCCSLLQCFMIQFAVCLSLLPQSEEECRHGRLCRCSVLQCVAVCCSVCCSLLQSIAVYCSLLQYRCHVLQRFFLIPCVAVRCSEVNRVADCCSVLYRGVVCCGVPFFTAPIGGSMAAWQVVLVLLLCVAVCCSLLQSVSFCCSVWQCVAA